MISHDFLQNIKKVFEAIAIAIKQMHEKVAMKVNLRWLSKTESVHVQT